MAKSKETVNPMLSLLGTFFRLERKRLGLSSAKVAERIGVADSYYRLVEAGHTVLAEKHIFSLVDIFNESRIEFGRLAKYMVGAQWLSSEMAKHTGTDSGQLAMKVLASRDHEFETLLHRVKMYFEATSGEKESENAAVEVGRFLQGAPARLDTATEAATADPGIGEFAAATNLGNIFSLNADYLVDFIQSLGQRQFLHTGTAAWDWERSNAARFTSAVCLYESPATIVDEQNLAHFHFWYLEKPLFKQLRFMFLDPGSEDEQSLKTKFFKELNKHRRIPHSPHEMAKVEILPMTSSQRNQCLPQLASLREGIAPFPGQLDGYWSFTVANGLEIGFGRREVKAKSGFDETRFEVVNLTLSTSIERRQLFNKIWTDVRP